MSGVEEFWPKHLAAIEAEDMTTKDYAEREDLSVHML